MSASIYDVAQRSGVSVATVSRVLNKSGKVRPETIEKVRKAVQELQYAQNLMAKGLAEQRSRFVGVILPSVLDGNSTYVVECLAGVGQALEAEGYHVLLLYENTGGVEACEQYLRDHLIAGVLALSASSAPELIDRLSGEEGCPVGYIGPPRSNFACNVYANYPGYTAELVRQLCKAGKDKVLLFCAQPMYEEKLRQELGGVDSEVSIEWCCREEHAPAQWQKRIADEVRKVAAGGTAAVFTGSVSEAACVLATCREERIPIPEKISLITVEHSAEEGRLFVPGVDTYLVPAHEMGEKLAQMLLRRMQGDVQEERLIIQGKYHRSDDLK